MMHTTQGLETHISSEDADSIPSLELQEPKKENQVTVGLFGWDKPRKPKQHANKGHPLKKPKRILNAYNLFFKHHKHSIQEDIRAGRLTAYGNLAREVSKRWRALVPEDKAYFVHLYKLDKKRHENEMKVWKEQKKLQEQEELRQQQEQALLVDMDPLPLIDPCQEVDSNPYLVDPMNMQRLAFNLGDDCTRAFVRAFISCPSNARAPVDS